MIFVKSPSVFVDFIVQLVITFVIVEWFGFLLIDDANQIIIYFLIHAFINKRCDFNIRLPSAQGPKRKRVQLIIPFPFRNSFRLKPAFDRSLSFTPFYHQNEELSLNELQYVCIRPRNVEVSIGFDSLGLFFFSFSFLFLFFPCIVELFLDQLLSARASFVLNLSLSRHWVGIFAAWILSPMELYHLIASLDSIVHTLC
jgi:hypothetical protein